MQCYSIIFVFLTLLLYRVVEEKSFVLLANSIDTTNAAGPCAKSAAHLPSLNTRRMLMLRETDSFGEDAHIQRPSPSYCSVSLQ